MPADPPMQLKIETCHADADSCRELCTIAMQREGIMEALVTCSVTFEASRTNVTVVYDKYNGGSDCPSSGDDVAVPPTPQPGF